MSHKDNLKLLYNSLPEGMCDNENESLEQGIIDFETFQYSHDTIRNGQVRKTQNYICLTWYSSPVLLVK